MKLELLKGTAIAAGLLLISTGVHAALIGSTDGLIDTDTGLEWLDVTVNENISYNQMQVTNLNGYGSQGYRYAQVTEVGQLWLNAGLPSLPLVGNTFGLSPAAFAAADLLISFLGANSISETNTFIQAMSGTSINDFDSVRAPWIRGTCSAGVNCSGGGNYGGFQPSTDIVSATIGHWLVREINGTVPSPATFLLMLVAMGALGLVKRGQN